MNKILVTGAHGQLGKELNFLSSAVKNYSFAFAAHSNLDIADIDSIHNFLSKEKISFVINCAAYTAVDKAETEVEKAFAVNTAGAKNMAAAAKEHGAKFIHFSTDFVFDGARSIPYLETDIPHPLSAYGISKLSGEEKIFSVNQEALVIRTSWVYSSFGNNFVKTILKLCKEREQLNIIYDQIGSPTYARDLASAVLHIIQQCEWKPGIYNYSNEGVASWYDFAIATRNFAGLHTKINPIETSQYPTPAARPKYSVLNKSKIKQTFNLEIPYWRESLEKCMLLLK